MQHAKSLQNYSCREHAQHCVTQYRRKMKRQAVSIIRPHTHPPVTTKSSCTDIGVLQFNHLWQPVAADTLPKSESWFNIPTIVGHCNRRENRHQSCTKFWTLLLSANNWENQRHVISKLWKKTRHPDHFTSLNPAVGCATHATKHRDHGKKNPFNWAHQLSTSGRCRRGELFRNRRALLFHSADPHADSVAQLPRIRAGPVHVINATWPAYATSACRERPRGALLSGTRDL